MTVTHHRVFGLVMAQHFFQNAAAEAKSPHPFSIRTHHQRIEELALIELILLLAL